MKDLSRWFEKQRRREARVVYLEDALLSDRTWAYAWYRLRFFLLRYGAASLLHAIAALLAFSVFSFRAFAGIVLVHTVAGLAGSFWWGGLEVMRGRIRELQRTGKPHLVGEEIGRWLGLGVGLGMATLLGTGAWLYWHVAVAGRAVEASDLYLVAIGLGAALAFFTRCFHSGVYALRRIYRPLGSIVVVQLISFGTLPALWPFIGAWSLPIAALLSTFTTAAVTLHYTARVYRFFDFRPRELMGWREPLPRDVAWGEFCVAGASYALMKLDGVLILGFFGITGATGGLPALFALLFAMGPSIQAGFDWAQLFYFDFKRLEIRPFSNLRRRYERFLFRIAWPIGIVFWALGTATAFAVYREPLGALVWLLLPFFLSRSLLAFVQIRAFSAGHYGALLFSGALCIAGPVALRFADVTENGRLLGVSVAMVAAALFLALSQRWTHDDSDAADPLPLTEWLARASAAPMPSRVRALRFDIPTLGGQAGDDETEGDARWKHLQVARRIARRLGREGLVTVVHPSRVVWLEPANPAAALDRDWLAGLGGGLIQELGETDIRPDGGEALRAGVAASLLGITLPHRAGSAAEAGDATALRHAFEQAFPEGACFQPDAVAAPFFKEIGPRERRAILFDALRWSRDFRPSGGGSRYDVTALCDGGELRLLFVVDRRQSPRKRARWRARVREANLRAALAAAPGEKYRAA